MKLRPFAAAAVVAGLVFAGGGTATAQAAPSPQPRLSQGQVVQRDQLAPQMQRLLASVDVQSATFTVERASAGSTFLRGDDGWILDIPSPDPQNPSTQNFEAGACAGGFFAIRRVANYLEWGASNTCESTSGSFYPHTIEDTVRIGIDPFNLRRLPLYTDVGGNDPYARVASVAGDAICVEDNERVYDQVVNVTVRGTRYGPFVDGDSTAACDLSP